MIEIQHDLQVLLLPKRLKL